MNNLFDLTTPIVTRWANPENYKAETGAGGQANFGRKGSPCRGELKSGETWTLLDFAGSGTIRHLWVTLSERSPQALRGIVIRFFWDGASTPAIEAPLGDFFACPLGIMPAFSSVWFDTAESRNFNCRLPMPFRRGCRIEVQNQSPLDIRMFWYDIVLTCDEQHSAQTGYLHAHYRRENPTQIRRDFEILPSVEGRGRYLGCNIAVRTNKKTYGASWWGEGEVKVFLDGDDEFPTLCGTGTEDYIRTSWGQGQFALPSYGCPLADQERGEFAFYKWHDYDPVDFIKRIRITVQQIGYASRGGMAQIMEQCDLPEVMPAGDGHSVLTREELRQENPDGSLMFERSDDWCATAYFYLDRPENNLPPIEEYSARVADLGEGEQTRRMDI